MATLLLPPPPPPPANMSPPRRVVNFIHGTASRGKGKEAEGVLFLRGDQPKGESQRSCHQGNLVALSFSDLDLESLILPHNDALVVTLRIGDCDVKRVLIDQGSSADVMYYPLFKQMGFTDKDLLPTEGPLVGFTGTPEWPLGRISLPVRVGTRRVPIDFIVMNSQGPYNALLGRHWLHSMGAVSSTYHQCIKYPGAGNTVEVLKGNQQASRDCYVGAIAKSKSAKILSIEETDLPALEDVGKSAADKSIEDLSKVPVDDSTDCQRFFYVGSQLAEAER